MLQVALKLLRLIWSNRYWNPRVSLQAVCFWRVNLVCIDCNPQSTSQLHLSRLGGEQHNMSWLLPMIFFLIRQWLVTTYLDFWTLSNVTFCTYINSGILKWWSERKYLGDVLPYVKGKDLEEVCKKSYYGVTKK